MKKIPHYYLFATLLVLTSGAGAIPARADEVTGTVSGSLTNPVVVTAPVVSSGGGGSFSGGSVSTNRTLGGVSGGTIQPVATSTGAVLGASTYNFTRQLSQGFSGSDVTALQSFLISGGYLVIDAPTGYFGAQTKAAVSKFQLAKGLSPAAGHVGPLTLAALNAGSLPTAQTEQTSMSSTNLLAEIQALQAQLNALLATSSSK